MKYPENCYFGLLQDYGRICMKMQCSKKMRLNETFHLIPLLYIPKCYHFQDKSKKLLFLGYFGLLQEYGRICMKTSCSKKMRLDETFHLIPLLYIPKCYHFQDKSKKLLFLGYFGLLQEYGRICMKTYCSKKMRLDETFHLIPLLYIPKTHQLRDKCQKLTFLGTVGLRQDLHKNSQHK